MASDASFIILVFFFILDIVNFNIQYIFQNVSVVYIIIGNLYNMTPHKRIRNLNI